MRLGGNDENERERGNHVSITDTSLNIKSVDDVDVCIRDHVCTANNVTIQIIKRIPMFFIIRRQTVSVSSNGVPVA